MGNRLIIVDVLDVVSASRKWAHFGRQLPPKMLVSCDFVGVGVRVFAMHLDELDACSPVGSIETSRLSTRS